jgi:HTH-type transcriptional regulator / antitoxin MqsA
MRCSFCLGNIIEQKVTFIYEEDEQVLFIQNVPAELCTVCGEKTFSADTTAEIMRFAQQRFVPVKLLEVPVFDYGHQTTAVV